MLTLVTVLVASYLLGSIPFGYLAGEIAGVDVRKVGSGNVGATNVLRVLGKPYGYAVFALDFLKGLGAVKISVLIATHVPPEWGSPDIFGIVAAASAVIGHCFPLWLKFRGGKGVATSQSYGKALFYSSLCIAAVVIWRHHSNLSRLMRGREPRFTRK